ncbi:MAG: ATP-binding cassette domain-containing protein [Steroidobacteraceae bacterium]
MNAAQPPGNLMLRVRGLSVNFGSRAALSDIDFDLFAGETLGLVGESGSGKSTLARAILRLVQSAGGTVHWCGQDLLSCDAAELRRRRRELQIIFQDPLASLDPRMTVGESIAEPLRIFEPGLSAGAREGQVREMLARVGLTSGMMNRYPHEFSGGQCQRIGIARAMILSPKLLICDEPVSSLDVSIQGQIVNLLLDMQCAAGTALLFISHNLALVRHLSHRVLVIYSGRLVEVAPRDTLFGAPLHPYTRALLAAVPPDTPVPRTDQSKSAISEAPPSGPTPTGCAYRDRCPYALAVCSTKEPPLEEISGGHSIACHRARDLQEL